MFFIETVIFNFNYVHYHNFIFFRFFNKFFFFADSLETLNILNVTFEHFISIKNLKGNFLYNYANSVFAGFSIPNFSLDKILDIKSFPFATKLNIKSYKRILKAYVKSSQGLSCISLIKKLNTQIYEWKSRCNYISFFRFNSLSLDFYLYKLLWKWCKKSHSRRPNSWIFERYWKYFSGSFKFCFTDFRSGSIYFLHSHLTLTGFQKVLSRSLSFFDFFDKSKLFYDSFMKKRSGFNGIYGLLYDSQRGVCPCCNQLFIHSKLEFLRIVYLPQYLNIKTIFPINSNLILIHISCRIY